MGGDKGEAGRQGGAFLSDQRFVAEGMPCKAGAELNDGSSGRQGRAVGVNKDREESV